MPVSIGDTAANLLLPLYGVIAAGHPRVRVELAARRRGHDRTPSASRSLRWLQIAFAGVLVLYALQSLYSTDLEQALKNFCLFYVPFAVLFVLLLDATWTPRLLRTSLIVTVGLALVFAAIGCVEFATGHLLITNAKVVEANDLLPYFRVNSLFFDPNIFGRYLALTMILLAAVLLWTRRRREAALIARRARAAVGRAGVLALAVELRRAAARPRRARRAALEAVAGDRGDRRRGRRRHRGRADRPGRCSTSRPASRTGGTGRRAAAPT